MSKRLMAFVLAATFVSAAWAQQKPGNTNNDDNPNPTFGRTTPNRTPDVRPQQPRIVYLNGEVRFNDGTVPPEPVSVQLVCNGQVIRDVLTATKGRFNFELGRNQALTSMSASVGSQDPGVARSAGSIGGREEAPLAPGIRSSGLGRYDFTACYVALAPLPGFSSNRIHLGFRSVFDKPSIGMIVMHRLKDTVGTTVSMNTLNAPKKARKAFEKGRRELLKEKPKLDKALRELNKAVEIFPEFASAWQLKGETHQRQKDEVQAKEAFLKASEADPKYISPFLSMAGIEVRSGRWSEAAALTTRLMELDDSLPLGRYYDAVAHYYLKEHVRAQDSLKVLHETGQDKQFPATHYMLGDILARQGKFELAAGELRSFLSMSKMQGKIRTQIRDQLVLWEKKGLIQPQADSAASKDEKN